MEGRKGGGREGRKGGGRGREGWREGIKESIHDNSTMRLLENTTQHTIFKEK